MFHSQALKFLKKMRGTAYDFFGKIDWVQEATEVLNNGWQGIGDYGVIKLDGEILGISKMNSNDHGIFVCILGICLKAF